VSSPFSTPPGASKQTQREGEEWRGFGSQSEEAAAKTGASEVFSAGNCPEAPAEKRFGLWPADLHFLESLLNQITTCKEKFSRLFIFNLPAGAGRDLTLSRERVVR